MMKLRCLCKGVLFTVKQSRLEEALGHRTYQCERCKKKVKVPK